MAGRKRKKKTVELVPQPDPRAPLDGEAFRNVAKPVLAALNEDLLARADGSPGVTRALKQRHAVEREAKRTADGYEVWRRQVVVQIGAAWLLSCVFVRTLEDRGLLERNRIAGPGARDGQQMFFQLAPYSTDRDYLLTVFREMGHLDAVRGLFAKERSLVWRLAPSAEAAGRLLGLFRLGDAEAPAFRFGQADTRFLGDLYQELDDDVKARYALLQTPDFVEEFILDRTLEPAIEKFGLERTELIDPTCGSGHFLLGGFGRLFERRLREEPGVDATVAASKALGAVYGVDINPYAVAIARFRLTLAFLEKAGFGKLDGAPVVEPNVVVADSLLHNYSAKGAENVAAQVELGDALGQDAAVWKGEEFRLEDEEGVKRVLGKGYAAVVGNPPYITVKDRVLRGRYAKAYSSCRMNYAMTIPFAERFFQLARKRGRVGMITANSFMKREFGKKLIEEYLPSVNLDAIVNTSGAYIPGHGTPTVLLFGSHEEPQGDEVLAVLANRGEPSTPQDPRKGEVWSSIAEHWSEVGFENDYVSVMRVERATLEAHPWSLAGGGASELKEEIERRSSTALSDAIADVGFSLIIGEDEAFIRPCGMRSCRNVPLMPLVTGENVRDWSLQAPECIVRPFDPKTFKVHPDECLVKELWPWRCTLENRIVSGSTTMKAAKKPWFDVRRLSRDKHKKPLAITFAFVATHNHFVLDRGGKVFNRSAPIIKLPETATEDDHLALLAYLNSSTACFWMKQVFFPKASQRYLGAGTGEGADDRSADYKIHYEFAGTGLKKIPLPPYNGEQRERAVALGREASTAAARLADLSGEHAVEQVAANESFGAKEVESIEEERQRLTQRLVVLQEDMDWLIYETFGLTESTSSAGITHAAEDQRPFVEDSDTLEPWKARAKLISTSKRLSIIEDPMYKRLWTGRRGVFGHAAKDFHDEIRDASSARVESEAEELLRVSGATLSLEAISSRVGILNPIKRLCGELLGIEDVRSFVSSALREGESVPFLPRFYLKPSGIDKHALWQRTWHLQRCEDGGEKVGTIPVPPKYRPKDFMDQREYSLRGPLDVPKERFISYPGCESDNDHSPVYGWAGWDHAQRAQALAQLYLARKTEEAWSPERLTPMLAGLDELVFWLELWHGDPHPDYGMPLSTFYTDFISAECRELGLTLDDLRNWRPPKGYGKRKKKRASKKKAAKSKKKATS